MEFDPGFSDHCIAAAKKRIAEMDAVDGGSVVDCDLCMALRIVLSAMAASICRADDPCFWDAVVMLQQIELKYRSQERVSDDVS